MMTPSDDAVVSDAFDVLHETIKQCNLAMMNLAAAARATTEAMEVWRAIDANFEAISMTADIGREVAQSQLDRRLRSVDGP